MSDNSKRVGCGQLQLHSCLHDDACYLERQWIISRETLVLGRGRDIEYPNLTQITIYNGRGLYSKRFGENLAVSLQLQPDNLKSNPLKQRRHGSRASYPVSVSACLYEGYFHGSNSNRSSVSLPPNQAPTENLH
jgi:hypothetical protein